jgi:2-oxoglutarate dehydrogenase E2 component (dihydrolipoamide succinyltransferase)
MATVDLVMPKMGESIMEATILKWHKQPGDPVKMDETVLEIATDKVDSEVPSTSSGVMEEVLYKVNDVVPVGAVIAKIRTGAAEPSATPKIHTPSPSSTPEPAYTPIQEVKSEFTPKTEIRPSVNGNRFYSPLVLNIAASEGVSMSELEKIPGTGNEGRVTKKDILQYVAARKSGARSSRPNDVQSGAAQFAEKTTDDRQQTTTRFTAPSTRETEVANYNVPTTYAGNVEIIELDRMRKLIAKHMLDSKHTSAHVTSFAEADVTHMVMWRDRIKKDFEKREGEKITFTPLFIEAIVKCIKKYPWLNSSLDGDRLIVKRDINIGMATALPTGNLIVPVIKNADQLNLVGLTKQVNSLASAARSAKLKPDDTQGGTFTLTNVGSFGSIMGTPIINQPQVAILAVGAIKKRPVVIETEHGDSIAIRHMMYISMSYDHRIIDGALGATFLSAVAKELENFDANREI